MKIQKSKVNILEFNSWKHELAIIAFGWLSKSLDKHNPGYGEEEFLQYQIAYYNAATLIAEVFTVSGFAGTSLLFAQEPDGPVILSIPFLPDDEEHPNTTVEPLDILKHIEECLDTMAKTPFEEGIYKVLRSGIFQIRSRWFCGHEWLESMYPEMAEGHQIRIEICAKCQAEREKND